MQSSKSSIITVFIVGLSLISLAWMEGQKEFTQYQEDIPGTDLKYHMVPIPGGTFQMGSQENEAGHQPDEAPAHQVKIEPFWMGQFEITWEQYEAFMFRKDEAYAAPAEAEVSIPIDGVAKATPPYVDMTFGMGKIGYPATNITQYAAINFCKWLTAHSGHFYRLPTEAEWEYACRAGSTGSYSFGEDLAALKEYGWYKNNAPNGYQKVGTKKPNVWGLHDMHGNVSEWTMDQYTPAFYGEKKGKTWNRPEQLYPRVLRGGSWQDDANGLRSAARKASYAKMKVRDPQFPKSLWWHTDAPFAGFRVVRPLKPPPPEEIETYWIKPIRDFGD
ncbi:MAG: formylglycine-generating enzyme family protein [Cyclobacteriaceae bacterium]